jgi:molecular chaperone DnaK (HSP70)
LFLLKARKYLISHSTGTITTSKAMTGREKKQGNQFPHSKKLLREPEGNEENRYSDPNSNKMKINYATEPNEAHKNNLKEEILQVINENFIELILDKVNQNVQEIVKKFQDNKTQEYEKTQKQINEITGALNKHQTETKITISRGTNELKAKIDNIK